MEHVDILIVGGGMVGTALAAALSGHGLKITVLERTPPQPFDPNQVPDLRVSALSPASANFLNKLGAWSRILAMRATPYTRMQVWEANEDQGTLFSASDANVNELGHIVENRLVQLATTSSMLERQDIDYRCPAQITRIDYQPLASRVKLADGSVLVARLLVAADGALSQVREAAGIGISSRDYPMHAMVATCLMPYGQQDITWQRFTPTGPQAFLPLNDHYASLVWYHTPTDVKRLMALPDDELISAFCAAFPTKLGGIREIVSRGFFPLTRRHANCYAKDGVVLAGDAAHTIHPLAGQGVNLGFQDAAALADVLLAAHAKGEDLASLNVLKRYEKQRRYANIAMQRTMDAFCYGFANDIGPLKAVRNLGLKLAGKAGPIKREVIRYALGLPMLKQR
ncbi:MAG TPA: FAD-dependent monooxygenase [Chromobacteriaceae bacterium]|nr:FAD-dependent monooxygenase [Chromobacteriaceae bacterium]